VLATETDQRPFKVENVTVIQAGGALSADKIKSMCTINTLSKSNNGSQEDKTEKMVQGAGDAGFLIPFIFLELLIHNMDGRGQNPEKKTMCLIQHMTDQKDSKWNGALTHQATYSTSVTLNVCIGWVEMAKKVQTCETVISTSLHGIIFAEALELQADDGTCQNGQVISNFLAST
jgi:hypothetical protein